MKTYSAKPSEVERKWYVIDAEGLVLGRLASQIALRLRGKHKPMFTPHIDALAKQSLRCTKNYVQLAVCSPSRTSVLTGRRPEATRVFDLSSYWRSVSGNFTTLPQLFRQRGYHSVSIGKIFHPGNASGNDDHAYSWSEQPYHPWDSPWQSGATS